MTPDTPFSRALQQEMPHLRVRYLKLGPRGKWDFRGEMEKRAHSPSSQMEKYRRLWAAYERERKIQRVTVTLMGDPL